MIKLDIRHRIQLDNRLHPQGSCNCTSVAMVVEFLTQFKNVPAEIDNILPGAQFEDKLLKYCDKKGLSRHTHGDLVKLMHLCGVKSNFQMDGTAAQVKKHLDQGYPCISSGYYTQSGHIVVIGGYTDRGFILFDPYGEWFGTGYRRNYGSNNYGNGYTLSYRSWQRLCDRGGGAWIHFCSPLNPPGKQT